MCEAVGAAVVVIVVVVDNECRYVLGKECEE